MFEEHLETLRTTLAEAVTQQGKTALGMAMFAHLFERYPETAAFFEDTTLEDFAEVKFRLVSEHVVDAVNHPDYATYNLFSEIYRHRYFDVMDAEYFYGFVDALQATIFCCLQDSLGEQQKEHWEEASLAAKACIQQAFHEAENS